MDLDLESAKNQQAGSLDASFANARSLTSHYPYPYNFGVVLHGFFVPFPPHSMHPNAAIEQLVPSGFRGSFPRGVCEDWIGHEGLGAAASELQELQLSTNSEHEFDSAPQAETRTLYSASTQQDWPPETTFHYISPNELDLPDGTVARTACNTCLHCPTTAQQEWHNEPAACDNMPNRSDLTWRDNTTDNPVIDGIDRDISTNLLYSNRISEANHLSGNDSSNTQLSSVSHNTETNFLFDAPLQASNPTYDTSFPPQESFTDVTIPSASLETSFSSTSTASPAPSPTNAPSPNPTRHPCPHPNCRSTFARHGDLTRHARIHFPERHRKYHCWEPGCDRNGRRGFTRRDKWRNHVRGVHGLEEDRGGF